MGLILTSAVCLSFLSPREDGVLSATAVVAAVAVREEERRVVLAGERERLRRRPGERELERERERVRCWKPLTLCWRTK